MEVKWTVPCDCGDYCEWCKPELVYGQETAFDKHNAALILRWAACDVRDGNIKTMAALMEYLRERLEWLA